MAVKRTAARPRQRKTARANDKTTQRRPPLRRAVSLAGRGIRFSRPRSPSELLALLLTLCAVIAFAAFGYVAVTRAYRPGTDAIWPGILLIAALAARLYPRWRSAFEGMTVERGRWYAGSLIIALVAISVTGHLIGEELGKGQGYLFLGPVSSDLAAPVALSALVLLALGLILGIPLGHWVAHAGSAARAALMSARARETLAVAAFEPQSCPATGEESEFDESRILPLFGPGKASPKKVVPVKVEHLGAAADAPRKEEQRPLLPPIDLFYAPPANQPAPLDVEYKAQRIEETLASFNVAARVVGHHVGPVVTQFDVQPERGVKVKSITGLQNDLALALAAPTIRIQAPVPGKPVVGIEIPNTAAQMVAIRELLESERYRAVKSPLAVVLGKDVAGAPAVIDLATMPHLLIAGATGSGKSVCVNALISCLLYANPPDRVRLMMIDPKMVELTMYNGVPHLLSPVVTQMDRVVGMLQWAVREMERRYKLFSEATVRNVQRYNERMQAAGKQSLPYIVIVVDELADLMMTSPEEVEDAICRIAQLARASGIHLVIATQRPSVDVVTGLIKANFPARIAFQMSSQVDSRTILDTVGAEKLLGRGDMLYQAPDAPKPVRLQGAYLHEQEIEALVEFWQRSPLVQAVQRIREEEFAAAERAAAVAGDELLDEAVRCVRDYQHASVSLLQRRLKIGYSRAARIMDQLEERGVVGATDGAKQRAVLPASGDGEAPYTAEGPFDSSVEHD